MKPASESYGVVIDARFDNSDRNVESNTGLGVTRLACARDAEDIDFTTDEDDEVSVAAAAADGCNASHSELLLDLCALDVEDRS
jgi:hypothetical protein